MENVFLDLSGLPRFEEYKVEKVVEALEKVLEDNLKQIEDLIADTQAPTWKNFIVLMETVENRLERVWSPISHINSVKNTDEWFDAYNICIEKLTEYSNYLGQNKALFNKYKAIKESSEFDSLSSPRKVVIENTLKDFKLSGIDLPEDKQEEYKEISKKLSKLSSKFSNNVLKSTQSWMKHITNKEGLRGLPDSSVGLLEMLAKERGMDGYIITLDFPSYHAIMTYSESSELRKEVYHAFATRASELSNEGEYDNSEVMSKILELKDKKAKLLGVENYSELSLMKKMADSPSAVISFLEDLASKSKGQAKSEYSELKDFAINSLGFEELNPWDVGFVSEKLKNEKFSISNEELKKYFPVSKVMEGMFTITNTLFGVKFQENKDVQVWNEGVKYFDVLDGDKVVAGFYLDLYARTGKRGGAWMDVVQSRWIDADGNLQLPVAYLVCNFTPAISEGVDACLTHDEVTTLFHEFGHGLQHMLTKQVDLDISGISGVHWDAVELPSQFMENFCWEKEGLDLISYHVDTGESLPDSMLQSLKGVRGYMSAMQMVRQIEFSLFDMKLHLDSNIYSSKEIFAILNEIRKTVAVVEYPEYNRFPHSFSHIFAGGYSAGYYSYKWAEVLSSDAFERFEEEGILNSNTGRDFKKYILETGGSEHPMELYKKFRGREPKIDALLRHSGIEV